MQPRKFWNKFKKQSFLFPLNLFLRSTCEALICSIWTNNDKVKDNLFLEAISSSSCPKKFQGPFLNAMFTQNSWVATSFSKAIFFLLFLLNCERHSTSTLQPLRNYVQKIMRSRNFFFFTIFSSYFLIKL